MKEIAKVSVLMSVYNGEKYLCEAIDSILNQNFKDFEFLIIDDCSTDGSADIIRSYTDPRIRLIQNEKNIGLTRSLNKGLKLANAQYIARMDADDISLPNRFEKQVRFLQENPAHVAVGCWILWVDRDGDPIRQEYQVPSHEEIERIFLRGRGGLPHAAAMFRREAARAVGDYGREFECAQDVDLFLRLGEHGRLANLQEVLYKVRGHLNSVCLTKHTIQKKWAYEAVKNAYVRRDMDLSELVTFFPKRRTEVQMYRYWSYLAIKGGFFYTARKHARFAVSKAPWSLRSWRRLIISLIAALVSKRDEKNYWTK